MNLLEKPPYRTVHQSFRLDEEILSALEAEARDKRISVSRLVSQILCNYMRRDKYFEQLGFIPMSKNVLRKWLSRIDEKFLVQDSKELGSTIAREYVSYFFQDVNKDTLLEFLDLWFSRFESYQHRAKNNVHSFAVNHDINMQYSIYMKEFLKALIEPVSGKPMKFLEVTPNVVSFTFET